MRTFFVASGEALAQRMLRRRAEELEARDETEQRI